MLNLMWRVAWIGGVFALFTVVVWNAFDRAPQPGQPVPVVQADPRPIKELVDLPPVDATVPTSTVLNLLVEGDAGRHEDGTARLDRALAENAQRRAAIAEMEEALTALPEGEVVPSADGEDVAEMDAEAEAEADAPAVAVAPLPAAPTSPTPAPPARTAALGDQGFRIQLAAVKPGEEMATYTRLQQRFAGSLAGLTPRFQAISTSNGVLVRVQAGPIESQGDAESRCRSVRDAGGDCFVVPATG